MSESDVRCVECSSRIAVKSALTPLNEDLHLLKNISWPQLVSSSGKIIECESSNNGYLTSHDPFSFDNIGVTRKVLDNTERRYLICGSCDAGPIGIVLTIPNDSRPLYILSLDRVQTV